MTEPTIQKETRSHYQDTPFDWGQAGIPDQYFKYSGAGRFIQKHLAGKPGKVLDCGCGIGLVSHHLKEKGFDVTSADLTDTAIERLKKLGLNGVRVSNLNLPFEKNTFDIVISSGVVHHTPDAQKSVQELIRVLKPGGLLYLLIYRKPSVHYLERITTGRLIRWIHKQDPWFIDQILVRLTIPFIYLGRLILFRTLKGAGYQNYKNYFYDRFITPQASFHTKEEVRNWLKEFEVVDYWKGNLGYHHNFVARKL